MNKIVPIKEGEVLCVESMRSVLMQFVDCIDATGGVVMLPDGVDGCVGDPEWLDLAQAYMAACELLKREPIIQEADEDE